MKISVGSSDRAESVLWSHALLFGPNPPPCSPGGDCVEAYQVNGKVIQGEADVRFILLLDRAA